MGGLPQGISLLNHLFNNCHQAFGDFLAVVLFLLEPFESFVFRQHNLPGDEWPDRFQGNFVYRETPAGYVENCNLLCYRLALHKRGGYGGTGLDDMEIGDIVLYGIHQAFVFVAPDDKVHKLGQHVLWYIAGWCVGVVVLMKGQ